MVFPSIPMSGGGSMCLSNNTGKTLRDEFAMAALQIYGIVHNTDMSHHKPEYVAAFAYMYADAMIKERDKPISTPQNDGAQGTLLPSELLSSGGTIAHPPENKTGRDGVPINMFDRQAALQGQAYMRAHHRCISISQTT